MRSVRSATRELPRIHGTHCSRRRGKSRPLLGSPSETLCCFTTCPIAIPSGGASSPRRRSAGTRRSMTCAPRRWVAECSESQPGTLLNFQSHRSSLRTAIDSAADISSEWPWRTCLAVCLLPFETHAAVMRAGVALHRTACRTRPSSSV
ncbi:hypothetical protein OH76DRAFT_413544 [Lentinus brumalis]|uniref:Uncharacterized protein n=1 Tax=Lentinus brumalis TaxID=2498619 RepID=A0A371DW11_9APHY|nr:hypothetical protein OH76DRAFT_413544 [Polyporus brumalis]